MDRKLLIKLILDMIAEAYNADRNYNLSIC